MRLNALVTTCQRRDSTSTRRHIDILEIHFNKRSCSRLVMMCWLVAQHTTLITPLVSILRVSPRMNDSTSEYTLRLYLAFLRLLSFRPFR